MNLVASNGFKLNLPLWDSTTGWTTTINNYFVANNMPFTIRLRYTPTSGTGNVGTIDHSLYTGSFYAGHSFIMDAYLNLINDPLPVELSTFTITSVQNEVELNWTTMSETNNYGFYIQKSVYGRNNFITLDFVPGHGTTLQQHVYKYSDIPLSGKYQYRLKQVDLDGTAKFSETIDADVTWPKGFLLKQNYPNPFNPSTQILFSVTNDGPVSLRVYDVLGREVATLVNENRKPGQYTESFNGNQMASGVYVYLLRSSEGQLTGRMMMLK